MLQTSVTRTLVSISASLRRGKPWQSLAVFAGKFADCSPKRRFDGKRNSSMHSLKTVDELCKEHTLDVRQVAQRAGLDEGRMLAIVSGRWTPSPAERDRVAAVFGLTREQIAWGHRTGVDHIHGHGPQFGRSP